MWELEDGFLTQGELLRYLGKNENDRKLISRMAERWEVYKEWGRYYIREKAWEQEYVDEIRRLRKENKELRESLENLEKVEKDGVVWDEEGINELRVNVKYYKGLYEKECEESKETIKRMYLYIKNVLHIKAKWEDFRDYALGYEGQ